MEELTVRKKLYEKLKQITYQDISDIELFLIQLEGQNVVPKGELDSVRGLLYEYAAYRSRVEHYTAQDIAHALETTTLIEPLAFAFDSQALARRVARLVDVATIEDRGWYYYVPLKLNPTQQKRHEQLALSTPMFTVMVELPNGTEVSVLIELIHAHKTWSQWIVDHEEWHIFMYFWQLMQSNRISEYATEYEETENMSITERMERYIADCIDTILYDELFAYLAGNTVISPFSFAEVYLSEYERGMFEAELLVQPVLQKVLYSSHTLTALKKQLRLALTYNRQRSQNEHESMWIESILAHLQFWEKVQKIPEFARTHAVSARDIAFLFQFRQDTWNNTITPNPFDHAGGKFKQLLQSL